MADETTATATAVEKAKAILAAAEQAHAQAQKDAPPRKPEIVLGDLLTALVQRFGNHHELAALLAEFKAGTTPKES